MSSVKFKKIIIGTAQFGMNYGVSNTTGIPNQTELKNIINYCLENNIKFLDTAATYGNSEITLGKIGVKDFKIITKIKVNKTCDFQSLLSSLKDSCDKLEVNKLEGVLLHSYISSKNDDYFFSLLEEIKNTKLVNKIGVSIYNAEDMIKIHKKFSVDIFQIPLNILNRGSFLDEVLGDVRSSGAEIHIRSIFLQGLLLMDKNVRPSYFKKWKKLFHEWDLWLEDQGLSSLEACLSFALHSKNVDKVLIGIDSLKQLKEIVKKFKTIKKIKLPKTFITQDKNLINPANWKF